jgi:hypothetical protein
MSPVSVLYSRSSYCLPSLRLPCPRLSFSCLPTPLFFVPLTVSRPPFYALSSLSISRLPPVTLPSPPTVSCLPLTLSSCLHSLPHPIPPIFHLPFFLPFLCPLTSLFLSLLFSLLIHPFFYSYVLPPPLHILVCDPSSFKFPVLICLSLRFSSFPTVSPHNFVIHTTLALIYLGNLSWEG